MSLAALCFCPPHVSCFRARTRTALRKLIEEAAAAESEEDGDAWEEAEPGEEEEQAAA